MAASKTDRKDTNSLGTPSLCWSHVRITSSFRASKLYAAEFQARRRREKESWGDLGDDIWAIADRAFPDLDYKAREQLFLDRFLGLRKVCNRLGCPSAASQEFRRSNWNAIISTIRVSSRCYDVTVMSWWKPHYYSSNSNKIKKFFSWGYQHPLPAPPALWCKWSARQQLKVKVNHWAGATWPSASAKSRVPKESGQPWCDLAPLKHIITERNKEKLILHHSHNITELYGTPRFNETRKASLL